MAAQGKIRRYFKDLYRNNRRKVKRIIMVSHFWLLLAGLFLTSLGIGRYIYLNHKRPDQHMNVYWASDSELGYRHMSVYARGARPGGALTPPVYINSGVSLKRADIIEIRTNLQNLADSGRGSQSKSGLGTDGRPHGWEDCMSSFLDGNIQTVPLDGVNSTSAMTSPCNIVAVEGNFPAFHPFRYMSGGFLPEVLDDARQIVINDVLAWKFYKSYDVIGNKLSLWGQEFTIIGVVSELSDSMSRATGTLDPRVYIYFTAMESWAPLTDSGNDNSRSATASSGNNTTPTPTPSGTSPSSPANAPENSEPSVRPEMAVMCYEAMLPEVIRGVAKSDMSNSMASYTPAEPNFYLLSNTGRFNLIDTWKYMLPIGKTSSRLSVYEFPYWEKAAQLTTQHMFADELSVIAGFVLLITGGVQSVLRYRKMS